MSAHPSSSGWNKLNRCKYHRGVQWLRSGWCSWLVGWWRERESEGINYMFISSAGVYWRDKTENQTDEKLCGTASGSRHASIGVQGKPQSKHKPFFFILLPSLASFFLFIFFCPSATLISLSPFSILFYSLCLFLPFHLFLTGAVVVILVAVLTEWSKLFLCLHVLHTVHVKLIIFT